MSATARLAWPERLRPELTVPTARPRGWAGWPLTVMVVGFPVWWVLGLAGLVYPVAAVPMAVALLRRRRVLVPPGGALWLLFLLWTFASIPMLAIDPPGTEPGTLNGRLLAFAMRAVSYLAATVILLWAGNQSEAVLPRRRIARLMGLMYLYSLLGGYLALAWPTFGFHSVVERLLPPRIAGAYYVQALVHPAFSQVQDVLGYSAPRPKAPFEYTNSWGECIGIFACWFAVAWWRRGRRSRQAFVVLGLLAAVPPVLYSLNRGLWLAIAGCLVWMVVRWFVRGHLRALGALAVALAVGVPLLLTSPLGDVGTGRLSSSNTANNSNDVRAFVDRRAVELALRSPVLGYGGTRSALGSTRSITVGRTSSCPGCGNPVIGSNGQLFMVLMCTGVVGALFYVGFLLRLPLAHGWGDDPVLTAGQLATIVALVSMLFYDALPSAINWIMLGTALMWRQVLHRRAGGAPTLDPGGRR